MTQPRCFGVLGHPIGHSRSPAMHTAAFEALGLPHRYLAFDVTPDALPSAIAGAAAMGFGGLNLTVPLKTHALGLMDALSPEAEAIGAVMPRASSQARASPGRNLRSIQPRFVSGTEGLQPDFQE